MKTTEIEEETKIDKIVEAVKIAQSLALAEKQTGLLIFRKRKEMYNCFIEIQINELSKTMSVTRIQLLINFKLNINNN